MSKELNKTVARSWVAAFNNHNLQELLALYSETALHYSPKLYIRKPETNGFISGKKSLSDWWEDAFSRLPDLHYELVRLTADEDAVFMEYVRQVPGEPDMKVAEILEIQDGVIVASRVYHG
jgi:predicted SnoaL-like aldol condensation-catalyzing enzyme